MSEITAITAPAITVEQIAEHIVRDVGELPDRTSPEGWPEAMIVTYAELAFIVTDRVAPALAQRDEWITNINSAADAEASRYLSEIRELEAPIAILIHCPKCGLQHVDVDDETGAWATTRLHRKHLCKPRDGGCGHIWAPSNRATVGVRELPEVDA